MQDNSKQIQKIIKKYDNDNNLIKLIYFVNGIPFGQLYCKLKTFPDINIYYAR